MTLFYPAAAVLLALAATHSLGGTATTTTLLPEDQEEGSKWEYSISNYTFFAVHSQDYANPTITADRDWLHLEARYNYEALKTGSIWIGYNFSTGDKLTIDVTPMLGGVFGNVTGIAPGYTISASYGPIEFYTQGEYFVDAGTSSGNFFYNWSELSCAPARWFRVGLVLDRTKTLGSDLEVRRGPLLGFRYKKVDFTTYWLSPGSREATFVFGVTVEF